MASPTARSAPQKKKPSKRLRTTFIVLLRGINVGGHKSVPMKALRALAEKLGFGRVETYIQSGNMVFVAELKREAVEAALERALRAEFGFDVAVVARTEAEWRAYAQKSPFREAEQTHPHLLLLGLAKRPAQSGAASKLAAYAKAGERVRVVNDALWIDFPAGIARSKLSPAVLDRALGSPVTARNWRTLQKLAAMAAAVSELEKADQPP
ncbi:MAG TPA: DUF1697 domain-containing protein [Polyangiaceae bacterium]